MKHKEELFVFRGRWKLALGTFLIGCSYLGMGYLIVDSRRHIGRLEQIVSSLDETVDRDLIATLDYLAARAFILNLDRSIADISDPMELATRLRNLASTRIATKNNRPEDKARFIVIRNLMTNSDFGAYCAGLSESYALLLEAFGIPSRFISLYATDQTDADEIESHASIEVYLDGRWIAMDPTYNTDFADDNGNLLGWQDIYNSRNSGINIRPTGNGVSPNSIPDRFYTKWQRMLIGPSTHTVDRKVIKSAHRIFPEDWNGEIRIKNHNINLNDVAQANGALSKKILR